MWVAAICVGIFLLDPQWRFVSARFYVSSVLQLRLRFWLWCYQDVIFWHRREQSRRRAAFLRHQVVWTRKEMESPSRQLERSVVFQVLCVEALRFLIERIRFSFHGALWSSCCRWRSNRVLRTMVVTKLTKRKRKRPDWLVNDALSILDLTEDGDEPKSRSTSGYVSKDDGKRSPAKTGGSSSLDPEVLLGDQEDDNLQSSSLEKDSFIAKDTGKSRICLNLDSNWVQHEHLKLAFTWESCFSACYKPMFILFPFVLMFSWLHLIPVVAFLVAVCACVVRPIRGHLSASALSDMPHQCLSFYTWYNSMCF